MDITSAIVTIIIIAVFAGAMYIAYQKYVVEGDLLKPQETAELSSDSSITAQDEVPGGVAGVDNMRGRVSRTAAPETINYHGGNDKLVTDGEAKTADVCKEFASLNGINNWGWDRRNKSCFAYVDSSILSAMTDKSKIEGPSEYIVGCTNPGVKVQDGCRDMIDGNTVWGVKSPAQTTNGNGNVMSFDACRALANEEGYDAFGYRTNRHDYFQAHGACFYYNDPQIDLTGWVGNLNDQKHLTACTNPSRKVKGGCQ